MSNLNDFFIKQFKGLYVLIALFIIIVLGNLVVTFGILNVCDSLSLRVKELESSKDKSGG